MTQDSIERQRISELAFDLWVKRGRPPGTPEVDWQRAEELLAHDSGIYPALRLEQKKDGKRDGDGFEPQASV